MKIKKTDMPSKSVLTRYYPAGYTDSFRLTADSDIRLSPDDMMVGFWLDMPGWVNAMFKLRNALVRLVGLKGSDGRSFEEFEKCVREGGSYGFVEVPEKTERETVIILRDKHLDAYLSILKADNRNIFANTLVHYNNRLGKVYFFFVRPFHGIIVKAALKRIIRKNDSRP